MIGWGRTWRKERSVHAKADDALQAVRDFTLTRHFDAPRREVFRAFVEPEHMQHWWAPRGFTMLSCALDLREGGAWRMRIKSDATGAIQTEVAAARFELTKALTDVATAENDLRLARARLERALGEGAPAATK